MWALLFNLDRIRLFVAENCDEKSDFVANKWGPHFRQATDKPICCKPFATLRLDSSQYCDDIHIVANVTTVTRPSVSSLSCNCYFSIAVFSSLKTVFVVVRSSMILLCFRRFLYLLKIIMLFNQTQISNFRSFQELYKNMSNQRTNEHIDVRTRNTTH